MDTFDVENLKWKKPTPADAIPSRLPRHGKADLFLAGPIPWAWLKVAANIPGKTLHVAMVLWLQARMKGTNCIQLQGGFLRDLGVSRKSVYRTLEAMESAGLIKCDRGLGRRPRITILEVNVKSNEELKSEPT